MIRTAFTLAACLTTALASSAIAQHAPVTLAIGSPVVLLTTEPLSSKTSVKGDLVQLQVADDVVAEGVVVIPRGTHATGQILDAQKKGAMGMSGRLTVRPLYLRIGDRTVRLSGQTRDRASVTVGAVVGMVAIGAVFTGRSATIPAGARLDAMVERTVSLLPAAPK